MARPYLLKPTFDKKHNAWRLNFPPEISPSGKRERHLFKEHSEALAERNKVLKIRRDYGRSINMLPHNRHNEAIECWEKLDEAFGIEAPSGSLRRIVLRECKAIKDREKSIALSALFDLYADKLTRMHRSDAYFKQLRLLRGYLDFWLGTKVSDLTPGNLKFSLGKLPSGNFNSNLRVLRAVFNHGIKQELLKANPAKRLDFVHRPKVEVKCLSHLVVEKMFHHAQAHDVELIPPYVVGFYAGVRESELWKLHYYSDIRMSETEKVVIVPAAISKVKKKRIIPLSDNAVAWLQWYFEATKRTPNGEELLMSQWTTHKLGVSRQANYEASAGNGAKWQQNCKRHAFASHYAAAYSDRLEYLALKLMGHSDTKMTFDRYAHAVTHEEGLAYWAIRP